MTIFDSTRARRADLFPVHRAGKTEAYLYLVLCTLPVPHTHVCVRSNKYRGFPLRPFPVIRIFGARAYMPRDTTSHPNSSAAVWHTYDIAVAEIDTLYPRRLFSFFLTTAKKHHKKTSEKEHQKRSTSKQKNRINHVSCS